MTTPRDALALHAAGRTTDALIGLFNAIGSQPSQSPAVAEHRLTLASLLDGVVLNSGNAVVFHGLLELLRDPKVDAQSVARSVLGLLGIHGAFQLLEQEASAAVSTANDMALQALCTEPLVRDALRRIIATDARAERVFAFVRRALSDGDWQSPCAPWQADGILTFATAAWQGEYVWPESAEEAARVAAMTERLKAWLDTAALDSSAATYAPLVARLCLYRPLLQIEGAERLSTVTPSSWGETWSSIIPSLLDAHVREPQERFELAQSLPSLAPHDATALDTSARVRQMYEAHPYPRWRTVAQAQPTSIPVFIRALAARNAVPNTDRVLIAGCGTGRQAAHTAISFPDANILALDLSRASLGYARHKALHLGIHNVSFVHGDLLELDVLDEQFALIFCSGVLHHLADPMAGWRQLVRRLHRAGVMKISLYSTIARRPVQAARALIAEQGFDASDEGIRACRQFLLALPSGHEARVVTESADFYSASGVRDLLMHVQERSYTLQELAADLDSLGLRFLGFQLPTTVRAAFTAQYPNPETANDLEAWSRFEAANPTVFWGMYQFFVEHRAR